MSTLEEPRRGRWRSEFKEERGDALELVGFFPQFPIPKEIVGRGSVCAAMGLSGKRKRKSSMYVLDGESMPR
jgi:hypothetical protein